MNVQWITEETKEQKVLIPKIKYQKIRNIYKVILRQKLIVKKIYVKTQGGLK